MLRYDTTCGFSTPACWEAFDAAESPVLADGVYVGCVFNAHYVYFVPYSSGTHGEVLRYDTQGTFNDPGAWDTYDYGESAECAADPNCNDPDGYHGAVFAADGYIYFAPYNNGGGFHNEVLRYNTAGSFDDPTSWDTFEPTGGPGGYTGTVFDGRYVYFVPGSGPSGEVLRYDTECTPFTEPACWLTYTPPEGKAYNGAVFDGQQYIYFVPWTPRKVLRFDTLDPDGFAHLDSWQLFDVQDDPPGAVGGYRDAVFDGRHVYFPPFENAGNFHGEALRYDTQGTFNASGSWDTYDYGESAECTADENCNDPDGYHGGVFDGRYVYFAPANNGTEAHGEVLRYDTANPIPTVSEWGVVVMSLLVLTAGTLVYARRRPIHA